MKIERLMISEIVERLRKYDQYPDILDALDDADIIHAAAVVGAGLDTIGGQVAHLIRQYQLGLEKEDS